MKDGTVHIPEGITKITPEHITVESLKSRNSFVRKIQIATKSVSREILSPIIHNTLDPHSLAARTAVVEFYLEAKRLDDAMAELTEVVRDFPKR